MLQKKKHFIKDLINVLCFLKKTVGAWTVIVLLIISDVMNQSDYQKFNVKFLALDGIPCVLKIFRIPSKILKPFFEGTFV